MNACGWNVRIAILGSCHLVLLSNILLSKENLGETNHAAVEILYFKKCTRVLKQVNRWIEMTLTKFELVLSKYLCPRANGF